MHALPARSVCGGNGGTKASTYVESVADYSRKKKKARAMAAQRKDHAIFEEDQVSLCVDNIYRCGLVLESAEYMSSEDEEDDDLFQRVTTGTVRVAWHPDGTEEVIPETKVRHRPRSNLIITKSIIMSIHDHIWI